MTDAVEAAEIAEWIVRTTAVNPDSRVAKLARAYLSSRSSAIEEDAARWRALMSSQRIRVMGSAGFSITPDGARLPAEPRLHMGVEFWDIHDAAHPCAEFPQEKCRAQLIAYVDRIRSLTKEEKDGQ